MWWPILSGMADPVPVPRTELVLAGVRVRKSDWEGDLSVLADGVVPHRFDLFLAYLSAAASRISESGPWFLRTGHTSGKFDWSKTCDLRDLRSMGHHVKALVEFSALAHIMGLPTETWAVRERLDLIASSTGRNGIPIGPEVRCFFRDGRPTCLHPYWPADAVERLDPQPRAGWRQRYADDLILIDGIAPFLYDQTERVAAAFREALPLADGWSIDWACGRNGVWYAIDLARGRDSWHWPGCVAAKE